MHVPDMETIRLLAGRAGSGERVYEELPAAPLGDGLYRLLASPGLVLGVAKDDEVRLGVEHGDFTLVRRGRQLCVQVHIPRLPRATLDALVVHVTADLNGTLDGETEDQLVFSIPVDSGFDAVDATFNRFADHHPEVDWYYGNVYDSDDGVTPLNWWLPPN